VKLAGNVDRYSPVDITGQLNLLSAAIYSDMSIKFRNMELTTFNPYSGKYAGTASGKASSRRSCNTKLIIGNWMPSITSFWINWSLEGPPTARKKVPLPIKLAAALLKDRHGVIDLTFRSAAPSMTRRFVSRLSSGKPSRVCSTVS